MELGAELGEAGERAEPGEERIAWDGGFAFAHEKRPGNEVAGWYRSFSRGTKALERPLPFCYLAL
jgi:hypothetical protein